MNISNKREVLAVGLGLIVMFALGRQSVNFMTKDTETKKTEVTKDERKDTHTQTRTVTTKTPEGAVTTTTVTDTVVADRKDTDTQVEDQKTHEKSTKKSIINISVIVSQDLKNSVLSAYGVSFQKEFLGPVTIGGFILTNGVAGVSIGIDF